MAPSSGFKPISTLPADASSPSTPAIPSARTGRPSLPQSHRQARIRQRRGQFFLLGYLKDARTEVRVHDLNGKFLRNVDLPGIGTAGGFGGKRKDTETFYSFTSFTSPTTDLSLRSAGGQEHRLPPA